MPPFQVMMSIPCRWFGFLFLAGLAFLASPAQADAVSSALLSLEDRWADIRYGAASKQEKLAASQALIRDAEAVALRHPGKPEVIVWHALSLLVEAEVRDNISALGIAKRARSLLEEAAAIDPAALDGMIHTTLGSMYGKLPGRPIAFGDKKKAEAHLRKALEINPEGLGPNFLYGDFLQARGRHGEALPYLEKAARASVRPGHEKADGARIAEAQEALERSRADR